MVTQATDGTGLLLENISLEIHAQRWDRRTHAQNTKLYPSTFLRGMGSWEMLRLETVREEDHLVRYTFIQIE